MKNKFAQGLILVFGLGLGFNAYAGYGKIIDDLFGGFGKTVKNASSKTNSVDHLSTTSKLERVINIKKALSQPDAGVPSEQLEDIAHGLAFGKEFAKQFVFKDWKSFVDTLNSQSFLDDLAVWLDDAADPMTFGKIESYVAGSGRSLNPEAITQAAYVRVLLEVENFDLKLKNSEPGLSDKFTPLTDGQFDKFRLELATAMGVPDNTARRNPDAFLDALKKLVNDTDVSFSQ